ncbi:Ankyrin repeat domain-containing protein 63 [Hypsizygus marmoreus]|uniref:Ankyrin repeat domain-containing protein 63 n=1 Tax=Hypsizygus marmoreus TaxID=39966 RepID=A0A369JFI1_HYPMA|nr:Ankyrin repeat domain-containing protein 63 [Hypsizygus marmoreus]
MPSMMSWKRLRALYFAHSTRFDPTRLSPFSLSCFTGDLMRVRQYVEVGLPLDLARTETPFNCGYITLIVLGAQRLLEALHNLQHSEVLRFLISRGLPIDVEDIVGIIALGHAITSSVMKLDLARILVEARAGVNYRNRYGEVAIFGAFQKGHIDAIDLVMKFGADLEIPEADGVTPMAFFLSCGAQVTAAVRRSLKKRQGQEAPRMDKRCDGRGKNDVALKNCGRCKVARYCSAECQRAAWVVHKKHCEPFSASSTITLKPFYDEGGKLIPMAVVTYQKYGYGKPAYQVPESHWRAAHIPSGLSSESKQLIVKVQTPFDFARAAPCDGTGKLLIYTKKRDFVCYIRREENVSAYDRLLEIVKAQGIQGAKAYFAAELRSKDELVVKVSEVLAEQPF